MTLTSVVSCSETFPQILEQVTLAVGFSPCFEPYCQFCGKVTLPAAACSEPYPQFLEQVTLAVGLAACSETYFQLQVILAAGFAACSDVYS